MRHVRLAIALVLPLVLLAVFAEREDARGMGSFLFLCAIAVLVAFQLLGDRR
jgi:hypothetical protein